MAIKLIVGLGNPGANYAVTRHNVGFWLIDVLAQSAGVNFRAESKFNGDICRIEDNNDNDYWLLKPMTFMNNSGRAVAAMSWFYKINPQEILVIHDELDLMPGIARLKQGGGHGGHNGLRDIITHISTNFLRLRLGIGHPGDASKVVNYVLERPSRLDEEAISSAIIAALDVLPLVRSGALQKAMNQLHRPRSPVI